MRRIAVGLASLMVLGGAAGPLPAAEGDLEIGGIVLKPGPQDLVQVSQYEWAWSGGAEKFPCISFPMKSGRFAYEIRHDRKAGNGTIGLAVPTTCNWYQAGMLDLQLNGKRFDLTPDARETVEIASGRRGKVALSWENDTAKVSYTFVLLAGDDKLFLEVKLEPKVELREIAVRLMNYPSGFNHSPKHWLWTPTRKLQATGWAELNPQQENAIFFSDETLDPANNPAAAGPSAFVFAAQEVTGGKVYVGGYGTPMTLAYKPTARRLLFCFWEFAGRPNVEALERFQSAAPKALQTVGDPAMSF